MHVFAGIVSTLADERHSADMYEETFKYVIGTLLTVDEKMLAQNIAHYRQTKQARDKAWEMKAVQSKVGVSCIYYANNVIFLHAVCRYAGRACADWLQAPRRRVCRQKPSP